jgi:hypothetical protein
MEGIFIDFFIFFVIIMIILIYWKKQDNEVSFVNSSIDRKEYLVRNLEDKEEAANLLAMISQNLLKLCNHLKSKYPTKKCVVQILGRFDPNNISEGSHDTKYSTYTLNKGEKIVYCLRHRDGSNQLHDLNTLMFVGIHEMAHISSETYGHNDEFKENFIFLLKEAISIGVYKNVDYRDNPIHYCGMTLNSNPLF